MSIAKISEYLDMYQNRFYEYSHEKHIERWLAQFDNPDVIVTELANMMDTAFFTAENENQYLSSVIKDKKIVPDLGTPGSYSILDIQTKGHSQKIYSAKLQKLFHDEKGEAVPINDFSKDTFIYIDDIVFTGMKARHDVLGNLARIGAGKKIVYILIGVHSNADFYLRKEFKEKNIPNTVWRYLTFENTVSRKNNSDVFWPKLSISEHPEVVEFANNHLTHPLVLRDDAAKDVGDLKLFTSSANRQIVENEFLLAGIKIVNECNTKIPPLGVSAFKGIGFGGTAMSYRNIPNNTPLCLWWGNPKSPGGLGSWYPLMMRTVYD